MYLPRALAELGCAVVALFGHVSRSVAADPAWLLTSAASHPSCARTVRFKCGGVPVFYKLVEEAK
jgi:hypothetical protein